MNAEFDGEKSFASAMTQIAVLPANKRIDALLEFFVRVMGAMDSAAIRALRNQIMDRFSTCGCTFETTRLMVQFIDCHLALREVTGPSHMGRSN